jgi:hypothetical protein
VWSAINPSGRFLLSERRFDSQKKDAGPSRALGCKRAANKHGVFSRLRSLIGIIWSSSSTARRYSPYEISYRVAKQFALLSLGCDEFETHRRVAAVFDNGAAARVATRERGCVLSM